MVLRGRRFGLCNAPSPTPVSTHSHACSASRPRAELPSLLPLRSRPVQDVPRTGRTLHESRCRRLPCASAVVAAASAAAAAPPAEVRQLLVPEPIVQMAICGERYLCVAHRAEYVLLSIGSGSVRELFRFTPDFGSPLLKRISERELLLVQPPPRAGERQLGIFLDKVGNVARRSTVHWRQPPLACLSRGRALVTLLPNSIEVHHPAQDPPQQSLPLAGACCAADGGDLLLVGTGDAVYALMPPSPPPPPGTPRDRSGSQGSAASSPEGEASGRTSPGGPEGGRGLVSPVTVSGLDSGPSPQCG